MKGRRALLPQGFHCTGMPIKVRKDRKAIKRQIVTCSMCDKIYRLVPINLPVKSNSLARILKNMTNLRSPTNLKRRPRSTKMSRARLLPRLAMLHISSRSCSLLVLSVKRFTNLPILTIGPSTSLLRP
jgi:hypothetical protein